MAALYCIRSSYRSARICKGIEVDKGNEASFLEDKGASMRIAPT
jgi:hypothetical protein